MINLRQQIIAASLVLAWLLGLVFAYRGTESYGDDHRRAQSTLFGQSLALKAYLEESLSNVESQMRVIAARVAAVGDPRAPELNDIGVVLAARRSNPSYLVNMVVTDQTGAVLHSARSDAPPTQADRVYFAHHRTDPSPNFLYGKAGESPVFPGLWRFPLSLRLQTRDGAFAGIVVAFLDLKLLSEAFDSLRPIPAMSLALIDRTGALVARAPAPPPDAIGRIIPGAARSIDEPLATIKETSPVDGQARMIVQRRLDNRPFAVSATILESVVHESSEREIAYLVLVWLVVSAVIVGGGVLFARQVEHTIAARETLVGTTRDLDFYKYALDHLSIVGITDVKGKIIHANDKFCEISKYSRKELLGRDHRILNSGHHPKEFFRQMWRTIAQGRIWRGDVLNRAKDGATYWVDTAIIPLLDADGKPFRYFAIRTDITARKKAEQDTAIAKIAAESARVVAEAASRAKSELIANTSHELRTPLNAIIGFSELMKMEAFGPLPERYRAYVKDINDSGKHLLDVVNDILDVSAVEAGTVELHEEVVSLSEALRAALRLVQPRAESAGIALHDDIPAALPRLRADRRRVMQVALNLMNNAVKFTEKGGLVTVTAAQGIDGHLFFRVADTGIGMDPDELAKAMTKFGQVDSSLARKYEGLGLGLPLSQELIALHDGMLSIESEKGKGTVVTVSFPRSRTVVEDAAPEKAAAG
ncbi:MAG: PAS domain S-box protein [Alphaproteobacteria bacterium]|nr:PAS domain S-box protein [Alphaproteobacteria bacterium]